MQGPAGKYGALYIQVWYINRNAPGDYASTKASAHLPCRDGGRRTYLYVVGILVQVLAIGLNNEERRRVRAQVDCKSPPPNTLDFMIINGW